MKWLCGRPGCAKSMSGSLIWLSGHFLIGFIVYNREHFKSYRYSANVRLWSFIHVHNYHDCVTNNISLSHNYYLRHCVNVVHKMFYDCVLAYVYVIDLGLLWSDDCAFQLWTRILPWEPTSINLQAVDGNLIQEPNICYCGRFWSVRAYWHLTDWCHCDQTFMQSKCCSRPNYIECCYWAFIL